MVKISWNSDKTVGGATVSGSEWNTMVGVISTPLVTAGVTADSTELNYVDGVTSNIQTQINNILLRAIPTTHGTYTGFTGTFTSGESTVLGESLYYKSDGYLWKTDADASATSKGLLLMSVGTTTSSATASYLYSGLIANSAWAFTKGDTLYLHTTAGSISSSLVTGSSDIVRIVGYALSSSVISFNPDDTFVELT